MYRVFLHTMMGKVKGHHLEVDLHFPLSGTVGSPTENSGDFICNVTSYGGNLGVNLEKTFV